mgnify:CR=1 FL=1
MFARKISLAVVLAAGFVLTTAAENQNWNWGCLVYCDNAVAEQGGCQCANGWRTIASATFDGYVEFDATRSGTYAIYIRWFNHGWSAGCVDVSVDGQFLYTACEYDEEGGDIAGNGTGHLWRSNDVELSIGPHEIRFTKHLDGKDFYFYFVDVTLTDANVHGVARTSLWTLQDDIANIALTPGPAGADGDQGPQGKAGNDGAAGAAGDAGAQGPQGKVGADGAAGAAAPCTPCADVTDAAVALACKLVGTNTPTNISELQEFAQTIVDNLLISANICDSDNCDVAAGITAAINAKLNP